MTERVLAISPELIQKLFLLSSGLERKDTCTSGHRVNVDASAESLTVIF